MDMLRSVTQSVLGSAPQEQTNTGAETVDRIVERVISSSLLEDRRDGCRSLKSLARKYRVLVGAHATDALLQALQTDSSDHELVNYALDTLITVTSPDTFHEEIEEMGSKEVCEGLGEQFTEILTKKTENIALFLGYLDEFDFKVRYSAVKLFSNLLENRSKRVQDCVLEVPSGVSKVMDLLSDSREVIRNHALLLLTHLTKGNATLQKIVVFENVFDTLFLIIKSEGFSEGGVVVEDCLELLLTLLRTSSPNQTLFKEGGYVAHMNSFFTHLLDQPTDSSPWSAQQTANVHKMLELVSSLVQPSSAQSELRQSQSLMLSVGLLATLCRLLLASNVPATTLSLTVVTIGDAIKGHSQSQEYFNGVMAPSTPPRPAVFVLLLSLVNEKQSLKLRSSVLYCVHCLLHSNEDLQARMVATLLPQTVQAEDVSCGQLLCNGLFSVDSTSTWLCAVALSHAFYENTEQKEQFLRVQLATGHGSGCMSLLQQVCSLLLKPTAHFRAKVGLLQLLALWLVQCPRAVTQLLNVQEMIPFLTTQISGSETEDTESQIIQGMCCFIVACCSLYNESAPKTLSRSQITSLVTDRIGAHIFRNKLTNLGRSEFFLHASKSARVSVRTERELCFDSSFVTQYRALESSLLRAVNIGEASEGEKLEMKISELEQKLAETEKSVSNLTAANQTLQESNAHLTQALSADSNAAATQQQIAELTYARDYYYYQMLERDKMLQSQASDDTQTGALTNGSSTDAEMQTLRCQLEDLQLVLQKKDETIYKMQSDTKDIPQNSETLSQNLHLLQTKLEQSQAFSKSMENQMIELQKKLDDSIAFSKNLEDRNKELESKLSEAVKSKLTNGVTSNAGENLKEESIKRQQLETELSSLQSEQEDLLLLLAEQDGRIQRYRSHLTVRGVSPPPGEEMDEEEEEDLQ